ncbi:MinD/ParA family ATP-binding protein [Mycolicibacterium phlei]|uniref:MinD/ParA family ATP-binding protein n=1 Tax=Mycolicibacterium phlei TaxID=1771 RepID=UPI00025AD6FF|nr:MinD/ParA family protein [Mycolicibacterium phlei]EID09381.1 chromosome partitioning ATPase [Mycolicibacterium phlei RIVM601174]
MSDRDDALRRELGWTGPDESPAGDGADTTAEPPRPPAPPRPAFDRSARQDETTVFGPPPARYGPPPVGRPEPWPPQPGRPVPPPGHGPGHPGPPPPPGAWQGGGFGPAGTQPPGAQVPGAQVPGSYADRIRPDDLVPARRVPPTRGWRRALYRATFGLINLGPGPDEVREAQLIARVRAPLRGHFKVGVMGKGGVGKTTVSASLGSVFAELRQDDRVVAIDADTSFGKLGSRIDPRAPGSYWELAADQHLETFADVRSRVGNNAAGLFVLAGEATPARRRVLDPAIYREATTRLDRHFTISVIDCSSTMDSPVTQEVLRDLDALVVVSSPWVDGAAVAGQTLDWLAAHGLTSLLQRTVIVLNDSDGHADKRTRSILAQQFSSHGQRVIEVPFDGNLRPGGVINGTADMTPATRQRFIEIAAALAEYFPNQDDRRY